MTMKTRSKVTTNAARLALLTLPLAYLTGCGGDSYNTITDRVEAPEVAVIAAIGNDFLSSSISIAESVEPGDIVNDYAASDRSDIAVAAQGNYFYRIGRFQQDNITKYHFDTPAVAEWQFSVNSEGESGSNPYDIVFASDNKAYVLRYGSSKMWIVDPSVSAADEDQFKLGEIDLSAYDSADGIPEMNAAVLSDGKLYVTLQGLDRANGYTPAQAYLVVIDTTTDTEVNTGKGGNLPGMPLQVKNPYDLELHNGKIYIAGAGNLFPTEYTGGVERINLSDYSSELLIDDSNAVGQITGLEVVSDNQAIIRAYASFGSESLYTFDLVNQTLSTAPFAGIQEQNLKSVELDREGRLWVGFGSATAPMIQILNVATEAVETELALTKDPSQIVFVERGQ
ncbi:hypothetical protein OLMES_2590 [Oleiphilus messinensis]|uniref:Lipoprotein n=1 Tax=Oleiphilus messinensis TaxID=141451 RepID=A0A1Y0I8S1_9GAMM|nr:hypothetical protein [Oleiphilus messinensis]ARU56640.1 hypothetical protein OLMES_2590 [Oleiphilus messinensis]